MLCTCIAVKISAAECHIDAHLWLQHLDPVSSQKVFAATWKQKAIFYNPFTLQNMSQWLPMVPLSSSACTGVRRITVPLGFHSKLEVSLPLLVSVALLIFCNGLPTSSHANVMSKKPSGDSGMGFHILTDS